MIEVSETELTLASSTQLDNSSGVYSFHVTVDAARPPFGRSRVLTVCPMLVAVNRCPFAVLCKAHDKADPVRLNPNGGRADIHHAQELGATTVRPPPAHTILYIYLYGFRPWSVHRR